MQFAPLWLGTHEIQNTQFDGQVEEEEEVEHTEKYISFKSNIRATLREKNHFPTQIKYKRLK